ncbi:alpha/beta hydrolase [Hoeflea sp. WL0058]|uniref:Alpha/beta hydrolase n=1 Tax=Flavimaribacter sediminis TaxID=2865987 RepID=A0AAE2ZJN7_9HYPH|nr:alpha/beta hydrolase [Flavimaribacter sediminis]MBW8636286.1 alpha/beta hydrolase [Flavimaribacter sediminis]
MNLLNLLLPALVLGMFLSGCAGPPDNIIGLAAPAEAINAYGVKKQDVYVMTTRAASDDPSVMYSGERSEGLGLARVTVTIPPDHQTGVIERSEKGPPDPRTNFTIVDPIIFGDAEQFQASVGAELAERSKPDQRILLFVHGYNTTMTAAILRTAQLANDMNFKGVPVVFSWASRGKTLNYVYDMNSALSARDRLIEGATLLAEAGPAEFDIMAHSMGNLLTVEAIRQAHLQGQYDASGRVKNIILASPDIDMDLFTTQLDDLPADRRQFWVMISENDRALSVSQRIAGGINRVGNADSQRLAELGVAVVDLSQIDDKSSLHHAKFADAPEVVQLIGRRLESQGSIANDADDDLTFKRLATDLASAPIILLGQGPLLLNQ